jgi:CubicO group peptidase (beta-lactamase class C family)
MKQLIKLFLFIVFLSNFGFAQTVENVESKIDSLFSRYNSQTPGVAVSIVKDGQIIYTKGFGSANLEYDIKITPKTIFHVASVSKQFTAFSIYLLEKQGKISLEDDVRKYIPEVPDFGKTIKIKHLIAHTSGLRDQWALLTLAGWRMDDVITTEQILKLVNKQKELNFEPGSQFSYSNTGFSLAAEIVARVSGKTFAEFTKENIFEPLKMTNTQFYDDAEKVVKNRAYSYELDKGIYEKRNLNYSNVGATSLMTTVEDQPSLLNDGKPVHYAVIEGENSYHAKGQFTRNYRGLDLLNHSGHDAGFRTFLLRFPAKRLSIILLSNDEHIEIFKNAFEIAGLYLKNDLKEKKAITATEIPKPTEKFTNNLNDFEGEYFSEELATTYFVKVKEGKLIASHRRLRDIALTEAGTDKFSGTNTFQIEVGFVRDGKKSVTGFKVSNFGAKNVMFTKVK